MRVKRRRHIRCNMRMRLTGQRKSQLRPMGGRALIPSWLIILAWVSLGVAVLCALILLVDLFGHPQKMWIMDVVWPITALYSGPLGLWFYFNADFRRAKVPLL